MKLIYSQLISLLFTSLFFIACLTIPIVGAQPNGSTTSVPFRGVINYTLAVTPTPAPTQTPAPTPATNLAVIPDFWENNPGWSLDGNSAKYPVTYQGQQCIKISRNPAYINTFMIPNGWYGLNELDGPYVPISSADHIVFSAWIWVEPSTLGWGGGGLMMALDIYTASHVRITELTGDGVGYPWNGVARKYVPWGSTGWTKLTIEFDVLPTYLSDGQTVTGGGQPAGTPMTPGYIIPWFQLQNWQSNDDYASAYIYGTEFYIYPSI